MPAHSMMRGATSPVTRFGLGLVLAGWLCGAAFAQTPAPAAPAAHANPTKPELVARLVQLQQGQVQMAARTIVEQPAMQLLQQAAILVQQRLPADQREAAIKDIQAEARKYVEEVSPIMRDSVQRLAAQTMAPLLDEKFNEDELRQLIQIFESPALRKYEQTAGDLQRALREKLLADVRGRFEERFRALEQAVGKRLGIAAPAAAAAPKAPASAPRKP